MPKRALSEHRPYLLASLIAAVSYYFVADDPIGGIWLMGWKAAGVGFLALYAAHRGKGFDACLIAAVMAFGAMGDALLEVSYLIGGALFAVGHLIAIWLYLRHRRGTTTGTQKATGLALLIFTPILAALITYPLPNWHLPQATASLSGRWRQQPGPVTFRVTEWEPAQCCSSFQIC